MQPRQQGSRDNLADRHACAGGVSPHFCDQALREFDGERRLGVANRNRFFEMLGLLQVAVSLTRGDRALPSQFPDCLGQVESPEQVASSVEPLGLLGIARAAHMSHIYNLLCHTSRTNLTSIGTSRRGQTRSYRLRTRSGGPLVWTRGSISYGGTTFFTGSGRIV